jgi:AcrR family transcriptional regulator
MAEGESASEGHSTANVERALAPEITRGGHVATGTSAHRRAKVAANGTTKSASTRQAIVDAARSVFIDVGYLDARVSDIVAAAEVAHGSFYTYFPSKREVFQEVARQVEEQIQSAVTHAPEDVPGEIVANLERANRRYLRVHHAHAPILRLVEQVSTADPVIHQHRVEARAVHVSRIERTIKSLQSRGLADPSVDAHTTGGALVSMLSSYAHWASEEDENYDLEKVTRTLTQIWVRAIGIAVGPGSSSATQPLSA